MQGDAVAAARAFELVQLCGVIFRITKTGRPLIATDDDRRERTRKVDSRLGHTRTLCPMTKQVNTQPDPTSVSVATDEYM